MGGMSLPRLWASAIRSHRGRVRLLVGRKLRSNSRVRPTLPTIESSRIDWRPSERSPVRPSASTTSSNGRIMFTSLGSRRSRWASRATAWWRRARLKSFCASLVGKPVSRGMALTVACAGMPRCFVTRKLPGSALERLARSHEGDLWPDPDPPPRRALIERAAGADALLSQLTDPVDADLLEGAPRLKAIANYAVGFDNIDLDAATQRGIPVGNTPDVLTETTADLAFALMMAVARRIVEADAYVRAGRWGPWRPDLLLGHDLHGATLGIVGFGRIGKAVARRGEGFGMTVIHGIPLEQLLERSDFVSLHAPLTPQTRGLIGAAELERMKPTGILVNTARGPMVDTGALAQALRTGTIAGAGLDVTDPEPLPADHPLLDAPNLVIAPHIGSASHRTREAMADMAVDNLLAALAGERMPHCANPEVYEP